MAIDALAERARAEAFREKFSGEYARAELGGEPVVLLKPMTYMNDSGRCVQPAAAFFKVSPAEILVLHDELDLPFGDVRLKLGGGHAGHNGLRSILAALGQGEFGRVRIGIGRPPAGFRGEVADFVLSAFDGVERATVPDVLKSALGCVDDVVARGIRKAMSTHNARPKASKPPSDPTGATAQEARASGAPRGPSRRPPPAGSQNDERALAEKPETT